MLLYHMEDSNYLFTALTRNFVKAQLCDVFPDRGTRVLVSPESFAHCLHKVTCGNRMKLMA